MEVRVAPFPSQIALDLPNDVRGEGKRRSGGNVSVGRSAPQVIPHSLTVTTTGIMKGLPELQTQNVRHCAQALATSGF